MLEENYGNNKKSEHHLLRMILTSVTLIIVIIVFFFLFLLYQIKPEHVSKEKMIQTFVKNKERFNTVAQYMIDNGEGKSIIKVNGTYKIQRFEDLFDYSQAKDIMDEKVISDIKFILGKLKYKYIYYSGGYISFTRTTDNRARGQKIIYAINDDILKKPNIMELS